MVKRMTLLLHLRNLFVTKSPAICHILALSNSSSERRKMSILKAELVPLIAEVRSLTVDIETQKVENYVLQKEVQMTKNHRMRVNVPAVAPTISCSLLFLMFNSFLPQPPQFCILGESIKMHATTSLYCFLLQPCT